MLVFPPFPTFDATRIREKRKCTTTIAVNDGATHCLAEIETDPEPGESIKQKNCNKHRPRRHRHRHRPGLLDDGLRLFVVVRRIATNNEINQTFSTH